MAIRHFLFFIVLLLTVTFSLVTFSLPELLGNVTLLNYCFSLLGKNNGLQCLINIVNWLITIIGGRLTLVKPSVGGDGNGSLIAVTTSSHRPCLVLGLSTSSACFDSSTKIDNLGTDRLKSKLKEILRTVLLSCYLYKQLTP